MSDCSSTTSHATEERAYGSTTTTAGTYTTAVGVAHTQPLDKVEFFRGERPVLLGQFKTVE
jgi:hypothetical protein